MGILGDFASKIYTFFSWLFSSLFGVLWDVIAWLGSTLKNLFQGLIDVLVGFFTTIYAVIDGLLYLLYKIGVLAVRLFQVIFELAKVLWALVVGFGHTLTSLHYTPQASSNNGYSDIMGNLFSGLDVLQLNSIAYILLFILWFFTAVSAIKTISSIRGGGE